MNPVDTCAAVFASAVRLTESIAARLHCEGQPQPIDTRTARLLAQGGEHPPSIDPAAPVPPIDPPEGWLATKEAWLAQRTWMINPLFRRPQYVPGEVELDMALLQMHLRDCRSFVAPEEVLAIERIAKTATDFPPATTDGAFRFRRMELVAAIETVVATYGIIKPAILNAIDNWPTASIGISELARWNSAVLFLGDELAKLPQAPVTSELAAATGSDLPKPQKNLSDTMISHGDKAYSIGDYGPITLTDPEDDTLQPFLEKPSMSKDDLCSSSGNPNAPRILKALKTRYDKRFKAAISLPGGKGKGGYAVRIRKS